MSVAHMAVVISMLCRDPPCNLALGEIMRVYDVSRDCGHYIIGGEPISDLKVLTFIVNSLNRSDEMRIVEGEIYVSKRAIETIRELIEKARARYLELFIERLTKCLGG